MDCIVLNDILAAVLLVSKPMTRGVPGNLLMTVAEDQGGGVLHPWKLSANFFSVNNGKWILLVYAIPLLPNPKLPLNKSQRTQT